MVMSIFVGVFIRRILVFYLSRILVGFWCVGSVVVLFGGFFG